MRTSDHFIKILQNKKRSAYRERNKLPMRTEYDLRRKFELNERIKMYDELIKEFSDAENKEA